MSFDIVGWHLELTRRCTFKCPACPRTYNRHHLTDPKQDLSFENLQKFFPQQALPKIRFLFFQGNLGDPILHPEFHDIAEYFFTVQDLSVITNGHQKIDFWERVLGTWPSNSRITLSIDGLRDTNHIYRVGARWEKIEALFELISKKKRQCKIEWKFIVFEHNHQDIDQAETMARQIGFDFFRLQKTRPLDPQMNVDGKLKEYWRPEFSHRTPIKYVDELSPFCLTGDMHYINARGEYFPCCWWSTFYQEQSKSSSQWAPPNIKDHTLESAKSSFMKFTSNLKSFSNSSEVCKLHCRKFSDNHEEGLTPNSQLERKSIRISS